MIKETNAIIKYEGKQITIFSDERNAYVNLTELASAHGSRKSIKSWMKTRQTIEFLCAWDKKNNPNFAGTQIVPSLLLKIKNSGFISIQDWIESSKAIGILSRVRGSNPGTWAHKDIAIRFAGWINPEFELYLVEEIQKLKELEKKVNSLELLNEDQILALIQLKEVFKYVAHQNAIEDAHKEVFAARSAGKNPFAEFNVWRNKILDIDVSVIHERIRQYCIDNLISLTTANRLLKQSRREQLLKLDSYKSVRNAVWDFLSITGEVNALHLSNLVEKMIRIEKAEVIRQNETDLFHIQQDLGDFNDFTKQIGEMKPVKTARQLLQDRKDRIDRQKNLTVSSSQIIGVLSAHSPNKNNTQ